MPAFSRRLASSCTTLACMFSATLAACTEADLPADGPESPPPRAEVRIAHPIDPGDEGQSRNLLQQYIARDSGPPEARIPEGAALESEAVTWELPFKSKRMAAALLTTAARDRIEDLRFVLHSDATWGLPDPRRPKERPIFAGDRGEAFLAAFRDAARRFPEHAPYANPTNFVMGLQEHIRSGSEPMWAFIHQDADRILFRFRAIGGRAWIDYVGFHAEPPTAPPAYDVLGPPPPMSPPIRRPDGNVMPSNQPSKPRQRG